MRKGGLVLSVAFDGGGFTTAPLKKQIASAFWQETKPMRKLLKNSSVNFLYYKLVTSYNIDGVIEFNENYTEILDGLKDKMIALLKIAVIDKSKLKPRKLSFGYALGLYDSGADINVLRAGFDSPALYSYKGVLDFRTKYGDAEAYEE